MITLLLSLFRQNKFRRVTVGVNIPVGFFIEPDTAFLDMYYLAGLI